MDECPLICLCRQDFIALLKTSTWPSGKRFGKIHLEITLTVHVVRESKRNAAWPVQVLHQGGHCTSNYMCPPGLTSPLLVLSWSDCKQPLLSCITI